MGQRLGIAAALLGDPGILVFDEPVNGLDPEGILWIRNLMKSLAAQGRTIFVSSHLMSEMENTAGGITMPGADGTIVVQGMPVNQIGDLAFEHRIRLHELAPAQASLEEAFMELTVDSVEFRAHTPGQPGDQAAGDSGRAHPAKAA